MEDFDKELMTDAEFTGAPQQPTTPAVQEQPDEFWATMSWMLDAKLDSKIGALENNFNVALAQVECALGTRITSEEECRGREILATNQRIDDVMLRIEAMELNRQDDKVSELADRLSAVESATQRPGIDTGGSDVGFRQGPNDGWIADHVVIGGWRPEAPNEEKVAVLTTAMDK